VGIEVIAQEVLLRHQRAFPDRQVNGHLLHQEHVFNRYHFIGTDLPHFLNHPLLVPVGYDLEPVKLDFIDSGAECLLHHLDPVLHGLAGIPEDEFNVHLVAVFLRVPDGLKRDRGIM